MQTTDLLVIDAHAMAYRAYYAMQGQNMTHPVSGQPTHAIFGFFRMLFKVLLDTNPSMVAVTWDPPGKTFRSGIYNDYKATRKPTPEDLRYQIDEIKELLQRIGFPLLMVEGFEADDLMGTLAKRYGKSKFVTLITGDKDCYQLLNKHVSMLRGSKGVTEFTRIDPDWVKRELGIEVSQVPDYMALIGDSSDNIPGAKGVGPKSAAELIEEFGTVKKIYKSLDQIAKPALRKKLEESKELVFLSHDLATIRTDVDAILKLKDEDLRTPDYLEPEKIQIFRHEGYNIIYNDLMKARNAREGGEETGSAKKSGRAKTAEPTKTTGKGKPAAATEIAATAKKGRKRGKAKDLDAGELAFPEEPYAAPSKKGPPGAEYILIDTMESLRSLVKSLEHYHTIAVDTETDSITAMQARLVGISLCAEPGRAFYVALPPSDSPHAKSGIPLEEAMPELQKILSSRKIEKIGQNIKYDAIVLRRHGIEVHPIVFDTMIASYLLNPNIRRHNLDDMSMDLLQHETIRYEEVVGSGRQQTTMDQVEPARIRDYACEDADVTFRIFGILSGGLQKAKLDSVNEKIEMKLLPVLMDMEMAGVAIDRDYFAKLSLDFEKRLTKLERRIHDVVGYEFNIGSTKELQTILFEKLRLPKGKKTKTGYSTDQSVLEELRGLHPMVDDLLEHRKYSKLKSTYVDALPALIHPETGRIHTSFNQTIAATGRLSSNDPNLQNIPVREESGRSIRRGFIAAPGNQLLSLDYSQIELRIMAHFSQDPGLMEAFQRNDVDIHARTAASLFGVAESEVTPDMRSKAKVVNFSIIYGVTDYGLGQSLGISREESRLYIERFFERYPGVRRYMDETVEFAEKHGYVETLSGRRRQILEIESTNRFRKEGAKRTAINTPIQGTSADIIKLAMISIHHEMKKRKMRSLMTLQVHDELLFDTVPEEKEELLDLARLHMEQAMELRVPLRVDWGLGANWDEAH